MTERGEKKPFRIKLPSILPNEFWIFRAYDEAKKQESKDKVAPSKPTELAPKNVNPKLS